MSASSHCQEMSLNESTGKPLLNRLENIIKKLQIHLSSLFGVLWEPFPNLLILLLKITHNSWKESVILWGYFETSALFNRYNIVIR